MKVISPSTMKQADLTAIERYKVPGMVLMENAGRCVAEAVKKAAVSQNTTSGNKVVIISGKGNNGGDGFVAARHLANDGFDVKVFILAREEEIKGDALSNLEIIKEMRIPINTVTTPQDLDMMDTDCNRASVIVDAIFGTGIRGEIQGIAREAIQIINKSGGYVIAVDIPSGISGETGKVLGAAVKATETVTMAVPKTGIILYPGAYYTGRVTVADIGMPKEILCDLEPEAFFLDKEDVALLFKPYLPNAHKGDFGRVFIIAGSQGMTGAATLAGKAAVRSGAGLVTVGVPESLHNILEVKLTEAMTKPLPQTTVQSLSVEALDEALAFASKCDAVALGPGLSIHDETKQFVKQFVMACPKTMVIDADAINALAESPDILAKASAPVVITPHPGEMARLLKMSVSEIENDRIAAIRKGLDLWACTILLKGARSLIIAPDRNLWINSTGNLGMATGGSGDVLTGIITAFIARGLTPQEAARAGAFIHGLAGDLAAREKGYISLAAGDIIRFLPKAFKAVIE